MNNKVFTVAEIAQKLSVSEETVRRWIRKKELRALRSGKEFVISEWELETFLLTGGVPRYDHPDLLLYASLGIANATKGAFLFDHAYVELEKQWERINQDNAQMKIALEELRKNVRATVDQLQEWNAKVEDTKTPSERYKLLSDKPNVSFEPHLSLFNRIFFMDIHFYFVAADGLRKAVAKLEAETSDINLGTTIDEYRPHLKSLNEARRHLEHIDERADKGGDLGNFVDGKGFTFSGKFYDFHIMEMRKLRDDLCDYFLSKTLPEIEQTN